MDCDDLEVVLEAYAETVQITWEQTRLQSFYSVAPHMGKSKTTPTQFMPFAWDVQTKTEITPKKPKRKFTEEEIIAFSTLSK